MGDTTVAVFAYAVAATLQPKAVEALFSADVERVRLTKTIAVLRYGPASWAVAHDFGAIVFLGVEEVERERLMGRLLATLAEEPRPATQESYTVQVVPGAAPAVAFGHVVVADLDARVVEIIALVVAQSAAMEYYESDVDDLVTALAKRSARLERDGALRGSAREMMRLIGRGMRMRSNVIHTLSLLDSPGATWENEPLDRLYRGLRVAFEIEERYRALDHEIRIVQDDLALMVDIIRQRRFIMLEVVVTIFVVVETLIFVAQLLLSHR